jgi:hypothetical protein
VQVELGVIPKAVVHSSLTGRVVNVSVSVPVRLVLVQLLRILTVYVVPAKRPLSVKGEPVIVWVVVTGEVVTV